MKQIFTLFTIAFFAIQVNAQKGILADKIVAVIGDKIILYSDIQNRIDDAKRNGVDVPPNATCFMLENLLASKVLSQQAIKDSLPISDEDIEAQLDLRVRQYIQQLGSVEELERQAGKTVYQLKEDSRDQIREQKLAEEMQKEIMRSVKITPTEVRNYFNRIPKDSLPFYESQVEVGQIVITPKATRAIIDLTKEELNDIRTRVINGERKFEFMAKTYSEDPGTKDDGGLFTFKRSENNVDQDFKIATIKLKNPGDISPVIKSSFGFHIIQLVSKVGDEFTVRHILKMPIVSESEYSAAMNKLDSVRARLMTGLINFSSAVEKYSDDDYSKYSGGMILNNDDGSTFLTIDRFPDKDLVFMLKSLKLGEFSKPVVFTDSRGRKAVRIVYLKSQLAAHVENLKDDYSKVAARALEEKKSKEMEKWLSKRVPSYYLSIDSEYGNCETIQNWVTESAKVGK
jgi:peptidyl-prolyl cis-trans isomerase SurA